MDEIHRNLWAPISEDELITRYIVTFLILLARFLFRPPSRFTVFQTLFTIALLNVIFPTGTSFMSGRVLSLLGLLYIFDG